MPVCRLARRIRRVPSLGRHRDLRGRHHERVKSLVYVAAFAASEGQSAAELGKDYPTPPGLSFLVPDREGFLTSSPEGMAKHFAQDLPPAEPG